MSTELLLLFQNAAFWGDGEYLPGTHTRARWVVADAMRDQAEKEEKAMAARLRWLAGEVENGLRPTKAIYRKVGTKRLEKIKAHYLKRCRMSHDQPPDRT